MQLENDRHRWRFCYNAIPCTRSTSQSNHSKIRCLRIKAGSNFYQVVNIDTRLSAIRCASQGGTAFPICRNCEALPPKK